MYQSIPTKREEQQKFLSPNDASQRFSSDSVRDPVWMVLFYLQLIAVIAVAGIYYTKYKNDTGTSSFDLKGTYFALIGIYLALSAILSTVWLYILRKYAAQMIWFTLVLTVVLLIVNACIMFLIGNILGGVIFIICAALNILWIYLVSHRIPFSAALLTTVIECIQLYPSTIYVSICSIFVQGIWVLIWVLAAATIWRSMDKVDDSGNTTDGNQKGGVYFILLVSFYWTSQVIKNVVHVCVAGLVATWYFMYPNSMPDNPTYRSLKRATWFSFGSICLGSLIVAVIKALKHIAEQGRQSKHEFVKCLVVCILQCLEQIIQYFNIYAFSHIAIYGKSYCDAAGDTWQLLKARGYDMIINDDLIGATLSLGALIVGLITGGIGIILSRAFDLSYWAIWASVGIVIGFVLALCAMAVIESAVVTIFICFADDPEALQQTKPAIYKRMDDALQMRLKRRVGAV